MSIETAATVLGGLLFVAFIFAIYLYTDGKKLKISIVDRENN